MIKILIAEDHAIVREGIRALFENDREITVIGEASNGKKALDKIPQLNPDLVLLDFNMPVMNGLECTRLIREQFPNIKILILSMRDDETGLLQMLDAGADGYLLKDSSKTDLAFAIKKIMNQGMYISAEFTMRMIAKYKEAIRFAKKEKNVVPLSPREMDVLHLIAQGFTNLEIANKLFTSRRTIETHRKKLLEKTHTSNTATLIKFAVQNDMIN
jgi:DNA-binding NarL/FixJ family response regulator